MALNLEANNVRNPRSGGAWKCNKTFESVDENHNDFGNYETFTLTV